MKILFIIFALLSTMTSWAQEHTFRDPEIALKYRKESIEAIKQRMLEIKEARIEAPNQDQTFDIEGVGSYILKFDLADKQGTVLNNRRREEITLDFDADQCIKKVAGYCDAYRRDLAQYKKDYNVTYKPKKIVYPKLDFENLSYRLADGSGYNFNIGVALRPTSTTLVQAAELTSITPEEPVIKSKKKASSGASSKAVR
jgi:hypothetical protein